MTTQETIQPPSSPSELPGTPEEVTRRMSNAYVMAIKAAGGDVGTQEQWAILAVRLYDTNLDEEDVLRMSDAYKTALNIDVGKLRSHTQTALLAVKVYDELERLQSESTENAH